MLKKVAIILTLAVLTTMPSYAADVDTYTQDKEVKVERSGVKEGLEEAVEEEIPKDSSVEILTPSKKQEYQISHNLDKRIVKSNSFNNGYIKISNPNKSGYITITADISSYTGFSFNSIYMDNYKINFSQDINGRTTLNAKIDMKQYSVGYHTITFYYNYNGSFVSNLTDVATYIPTYIYSKPSNSKSNYTTGQKYIKYYGKSNYYKGEYLKVYAQYKKGKKWSKKIYYGSPYTIKKFKPNKKYYVRTMYAKSFEYNAQSYTFTGKMTKKTSKKVKLMTAYSKKQMKKLIKSISVKSKVKSYKYWKAYKNTYYWWGYRTHYKKAKGYYTIYTVNIKFKKKPNIKGVQIKTKYGVATKKGNKKNYSVKFSLWGKGKHKKFNIKTRTFRDSKYLGISPYIGKKVRAK